MGVQSRMRDDGQAKLNPLRAMGRVRIRLPLAAKTAFAMVPHYGHLIPGANVSFVGRLDRKPSKKTSRKPQQSATPAQPREALATEVPAHVIDFIGSGGQS